MSKWKIDTDHASATFTVQHLGISWVNGQMHGIVGEIELDPADPEAVKFSGTVDTTTIDTGMAMRDGHLKSGDFLDAEKFPTLKFASKSATKSGDTLKVTGDLTIKDITKEVVLDVIFHGIAQKPTDAGIIEVAAFSANTEIDRRDFNMNWNVDLPGGKLMVGNEIKINLELEALKA